ncbi:MAG: tryptophan 2,3-dioxygenase [Pyrinomonadaceae bacterium]
MPLSYNKYLRVPELIDLQTCLSTPAHHDELLFITIHQAYELWFKQILHEIDAAIIFITEDRAHEATRAINRIVEIEKLLVNQIHILETMTPRDFLSFRDELNPASGSQSMQFREIEFASGAKDERVIQNFGEDEFATKRLVARFDMSSLHDEFFAFLSRRGFNLQLDDATRTPDERRADYENRVRAIVEILTRYESHYDAFRLSESLIAHDEFFGLWREHHIQMVERMVGSKPGTGGSEGVNYLRTTRDKKFFPELWEARTYLNTAQDPAGCPFAPR